MLLLWRRGAPEMTDDTHCSALFMCELTQFS